MNPIEKQTFLEKNNYTMTDLLAIMDELRSESGCAWDRAQTHASIRRCLLEEAYEVAEAIDRDDPAMLCEELGDLLFQVVFHAKLEQEAGHFAFDDVADAISKKMIERHPHVFAHPGSDVPDWNEIKRQKRGQTTLSQRLEEIPAPLPALMRADKLIDRMEQAGCSPADYLSASLVEAKERTNLLDHEKAGDLLLAVVADCRRSGIDCEKALTDACHRLTAQIKCEETDTTSQSTSLVVHK